MSTTSPGPAAPLRSCFTCRWYVRIASPVSVECSNPICCRIRSQPEHGCSAWEREPGADDEGDDSERWQRMLDEEMQRGSRSR